jgi:hypothetical protein
MSQPIQSEMNLPKGFQVGSVIAPEIPPETTFALRQEQFNILCDGSSGEDRAGRSFYLGMLISAAIGVLGLLGCVDSATFSASKNWLLVLSFIVLVGLLAWAAGCAYTYNNKLRDKDTAYSRLKKFISDFFQRQTSSARSLTPASESLQKPIEGPDAL